MGSEEIRSVAAKYQSLIGNIKASGRKCLDVENEQLRNDFQTFKQQVRNYIQVLCNSVCTSAARVGGPGAETSRFDQISRARNKQNSSQVHDLDQSLLEALKKSFDEVKNVKEACDVLDTFFSVSERTRIKDLYNLCKEKILQQLVESTISQKNIIHRRLRYLNKFYSNMTVELLRFKGLMVKERTLREDVLGSRFFQVPVQRWEVSLNLNKTASTINMNLVITGCVYGARDEDAVNYDAKGGAGPQVGLRQDREFQA